ncbi:hypothetical protein LEP1GSC186_2924 [Leptospira noguchii serovar Autumnalis str. ZUN142]|uniref:Uncharacterized protein n=1 Tax=Leptospira noguchii serovar Autumnalis str. ZUN142 TaxID=1085540 RepID=M6UNH7_9LEPT|nr:hypothetical protein LEP1GSC186_2924 [Leptospira noguchii serovar Autumnalis str. ZUN142]
MEIPKELERKARSRAHFSYEIASDSPKLSYTELTLSTRHFKNILEFGILSTDKYFEMI